MVSVSEVVCIEGKAHSVRVSFGSACQQVTKGQPDQKV